MLHPKFEALFPLVLIFFKIIHPAFVGCYWLQDVFNTAAILGNDYSGESIRCYICNSRRDTRCLDPFNITSATALDPVSCADVMSTRRFATYFAKLLSTLGIPVNGEDDSFSSGRKYPDEKESAACQKVEILDNQEILIVRTCSIFSPVACDPPVDQFSKSLQYKFCDVCNTDYCNGFPIIKPSFWTLSTMVALCTVLVNFIF